jgi:hypothetical protein
MATTGLLDAELASLYGSGPAAGDLVLDLTAITFLDVMGVMALRRALDQVQPAGRLRLGLPVANGPRRLLSVAVDLGWLPPVFGPGPLTF